MVEKRIRRKPGEIAEMIGNITFEIKTKKENKFGRRILLTEEKMEGGIQNNEEYKDFIEKLNHYYKEL